jgi:hypothetical protein
MSRTRPRRSNRSLNDNFVIIEILHYGLGDQPEIGDAGVIWANPDGRNMDSEDREASTAFEDFAHDAQGNRANPHFNRRYTSLGHIR